MGRTKGRPANYNLCADIAALYDEGYSDIEIARKLNVSLQTVQRRRRGMGISADLPITKNWLFASGVGWKWDMTCKRLRKAMGYDQKRTEG